MRRLRRLPAVHGVLGSTCGSRPEGARFEQPPVQGSYKCLRHLVDEGTLEPAVFGGVRSRAARAMSQDEPCGASGYLTLVSKGRLFCT